METFDVVDCATGDSVQISIQTITAQSTKFMFFSGLNVKEMIDSAKMCFLRNEKPKFFLTTLGAVKKTWVNPGFDRGSMKPTLYYDDRSPPVRSCLLLIKILNIDVELKFVDLFKGEQFKPEFLEINPAHSVPVLQHNNLTLIDSHAILIYLCEHFEGGADWWPEDKLQRIEVINKLFFECSFLFRRDSDMMSEIVRKGFDNIDLPNHERKILEVYSGLEKNLSINKYMSGSKMSIADLSFLTTLSTVDLMFPITVEKWQHLNEWFENMKQSLGATYSECNSIGLDKLKNIVETMGRFKFPIKGSK